MNANALGQDASALGPNLYPTPRNLPSAASAAAHFAAQLFEKPFSDDEVEKLRRPKVLNLVMQVFSQMLNTTPSPFVDKLSTISPNHTLNDVYTTPSTVGIQFGVVPIIIVGVIFAIATTLGNALVMV